MKLSAPTAAEQAVIGHKANTHNNIMKPRWYNWLPIIGMGLGKDFDYYTIDAKHADLYSFYQFLCCGIALSICTQHM